MSSNELKDINEKTEQYGHSHNIKVLNTVDLEFTYWLNYFSAQYKEIEDKKLNACIERAEALLNRKINFDNL